MHMRDSSTAKTMRRASVGPHALMMRQALTPFVPDRGSTFKGTPFRSRRVQYGAISTTQSIATGASRGAAAGAAIGTVVPIFGQAIGAIIGAAVGWADAAFNRQDPEVQNFDQAQAMSRANGPESVVNIQNKYLVLAGLFDLEPGQIKGNIPIYKKYGKMGEQRFVTDMINVVYSAAQAGQIGPNDNAQTVFYRIVQPWINSFGFGAMADSNQEMINYILMGLLAEYFAGLQTRWYARGGDYPFGGLPPFSLPGTPQSPQQATSSPTPSPVIAPPPVIVPSAGPGPVGTVPAELQQYLGGVVPAPGAQLGYARDSVTSQFLAVPAGATFAGYTPQGAWIVQYPNGQYVLTRGVLTPYSAPTTSAATTTPAPVTAGTAPGTGTLMPLTHDMPLVDPGYNPLPRTQPMPFFPTGTGSGLTPLPSTVLATSAPTGVFGLTTEEMLLGVGGVVLLVVLLKKRRGNV
jgi:Glycine zipper